MTNFEAGQGRFFQRLEKPRKLAKKTVVFRTYALPGSFANRSGICENFAAESKMKLNSCESG